MGFHHEFSPGGTWIRTVLRCDNCDDALECEGEDVEENATYKEWAPVRDPDHIWWDPALCQECWEGME